MSMYAGASKIARVICVLLQINFLLKNENYVFFTFGAYHFAASAITKGIFSATKDYASPFDVDGKAEVFWENAINFFLAGKSRVFKLRRIEGRAHYSPSVESCVTGPWGFLAVKKIENVEGNAEV
ncbi:hypothetical protein KY290_030801 [Solanum tuberosum]|uniref:Uncharacterized protein n=1 Tax=Solanum tuberosum TaxID=4113 RepID=A0ABQ7U8L9_SOLTU|nr:hypothetical protein KY290_030801 [Solanum tuberosum]